MLVKERSHLLSNVALLAAKQYALARGSLCAGKALTPGACEAAIATNEP